MRFLGFLLASLLFVVAPNTAKAQQYWTESALLADMFPTSEQFAPVVLEIDTAVKARAKEALGYALRKGAYVFQAAITGDHLDGYVLFDEQVGQHEPISFAVQLSPEGMVLRHEIVVYRERYGAEVRNSRFRDQFIGKTASDPIAAGKDIRIVSGATYSSRAMAIGVKRAAVLGRLLIEREEVGSVS